MRFSIRSPVPVRVFRFMLNGQLLRTETLLLYLFYFQRAAWQTERFNGRLDLLQRRTGIDQCAEGHVAADAAGAVEISDLHTLFPRNSGEV